MIGSRGLRTQKMANVGQIGPLCSTLPVVHQFIILCFFITTLPHWFKSSSIFQLKSIRMEFDNVDFENIDFDNFFDNLDSFSLDDFNGVILTNSKISNPLFDVNF
jgi:hypothetical protein